MKIIVYFIILLMVANVALAQEIKVVKESVPEIRLNDIIEIKIHISNSYTVEKELTIEEILPQDVLVITPKEFFIKKNDALELKYYEWITKVSSNSIKTITYQIRPSSLGEYSLGSTEVIDKSDLKSYSSNTLTFSVKCVPNNKCEEGENINTCSEDCQTGTKDGICDYKADGICDLDCNDEPDCKKSNFNINYVTIPLGVIILTIILFIILSKIFRKKPEKYKKEEIKNDNSHKSDTQERDPLKGL
jgi:hypothetical protein